MTILLLFCNRHCHIGRDTCLLQYIDWRTAWYEKAMNLNAIVFLVYLVTIKITVAILLAMEAKLVIKRVIFTGSFSGAWGI